MAGGTGGEGGSSTRQTGERGSGGSRKALWSPVRTLTFTEKPLDVFLNRGAT